ncbi:hypothetical protein [Pseudomonas sp. PGPPP2]|uniref:hypothetical protein n=1 Tax=Pseudomonas sp. PGPPP2 TaxID=2015554 RepID=UPI000BCBFB56|nr:hypothetical protein [Pseudomonas sp. PGPPP2]OYT80912.1 MAG: hypothetical protein CFE48_07115 [Pseudomonas sp. PGPPP2]
MDIDPDLFKDPENFKKMQDLLWDIIEKNNIINQQTDGKAIIDLQRSDIKYLFSKINECVTQEYSDEELGKIISKKSRALRSFHTELARLTEATFKLYKDLILEKLPEVFLKILKTKSNDTIDEFLSIHFNHITIPALRDEKHPGDDIFLFIRHIMSINDEKEMNSIIAEKLSAPAQSLEAVYGMCGLLIQASRAEQEGRIDEAYSYLIDASNMIGMCQATAFIMPRIESVANKRFAKKNAQRKHMSPSPLNAAKSKVAELFVSLKPLAEPNNPSSARRWENANHAHETIYDAMREEIDTKIIGDTTILGICRKLYRQEKNHAHKQGRPTVNVYIKQTLADGTVLSKQIL